jgi:hypothetical protein
MPAILIPTLLCPKTWEKMAGDERQRFCTYCNKHVHNLEGLSAKERMTLLTSPAASICSRYKMAVRRPAKGQEDSYHRHLLKYGVGVALTGSVLAVLWEWQGQQEKQRYYRIAGISPSEQGMPRDFYLETRVVAMGMVVAPLPDPETQSAQSDAPETALHEFKLDPREVERLIEESKPKFSKEIPRIELKR